MQPQISRPRVVVLVGLPGSGKSTWVARLGYTALLRDWRTTDSRDATKSAELQPRCEPPPAAYALSSDEIRRWLADDPTIQTIHRRVFATVRYLLRQRLELHRPLTFVDATNLTPKERRPYVKIAELNDCEAEAVFFDTPVEVCIERNRGRDRMVPPEAIYDMANRLVPPHVEEGFSRITVVRDGDSII